MRARNLTIGSRRKLPAVVLSALVLLTACVHRENGRTAGTERQTASAGLPPADGVRRYDAAIAPIDETRTGRQIGSVVAGRIDQRVPRDAAARRSAEREKQAIEAWEKEELAARAAGAPALNVAPPPTRVVTLSLPPSGSGARPSEMPLPRPAGEMRPASIDAKKTTEPPAGRTVAALPTPPKAAEPLPVKTPPQVLPPMEVSRTESPSVPPPPVPMPSVDRTEAAKVAAIVPSEPDPPPPGGAPAATVTFARQSAEISGVARGELDRLARDANANRLRQMELRAYASDDDPIEARKVALARALAVQSYLVDQGVKARIEVGGFGAARDVPAPDRVDVLAPKL